MEYFTYLIESKAKSSTLSREDKETKDFLIKELQISPEFLKLQKKYHAKSLTDINGVIKPLGTFDFLVCEDLMKKYIKWSEDYKDALDIYYSLVDQVSD